MINTVLYDMDGLLLDTEPLWGESMLRVAERHGIAIGREHFRETTGLRIYEVTDYWAARFPWPGAEPALVAEDILEDIIGSARVHGRVLPGVVSSLNLLRGQGIRVGLASSSPLRMIESLVRHFGLYDSFDCITSADSVELGKPHPAVFLHCARELGARPEECLVLEDSINGMIAGKAARMKVVVVPDALHYDDPRFSLADVKLRSLEDFDLTLL